MTEGKQAWRSRVWSFIPNKFYTPEIPGDKINACIFWGKCLTLAWFFLLLITLGGLTTYYIVGNSLTRTVNNPSLDGVMGYYAAGLNPVCSCSTATIPGKVFMNITAELLDFCTWANQLNCTRVVADILNADFLLQGVQNQGWADAEEKALCAYPQLPKVQRPHNGVH